MSWAHFSISTKGACIQPMLHMLAVIEERVDSRDYGCQGVSLGVVVPVDIDRCLFFCSLFESSEGTVVLV